MATILWTTPSAMSAAASTRLTSDRILPVIVLGGNPRVFRIQRALTPSSVVFRRIVSASSVVGSSRMASEEREQRSSGWIGQNDLLIVGPGVLGRLVAEEWKKGYPESEIVGQTMTAIHHEELVEIGIKPVIRGTDLIQKFPYVIFCAPPSRTADYPGDVSCCFVQVHQQAMEQERPNTTTNANNQQQGTMAAPSGMAQTGSTSGGTNSETVPRRRLEKAAALATLVKRGADLIDM